MIRLSTTSMKLEAALGGAVTTNELYITVGYYDVPAKIKENDFAEYRGATVLNRSNGGSAVTICAAPTENGTVRNIDYICIQNADTVAATITVRIDDGSAEYPQYSQSVAAGKSLVYEHGAGWTVI